MARVALCEGCLCASNIGEELAVAPVATLATLAAGLEQVLKVTASCGMPDCTQVEARVLEELEERSSRASLRVRGDWHRLDRLLNTFRRLLTVFLKLTTTGLNEDRRSCSLGTP